MENGLKNARLVAILLDKQFKIGKISFGIEPLLGLFPFFGDILGIMLSLYIYKVGTNLGLSKKHKAQMMLNIVFDFLVGLIPFLGDLLDIFYKANIKNLELIEAHKRGSTIDAEIVKN